MITVKLNEGMITIIDTVINISYSYYVDNVYMILFDENNHNILDSRTFMNKNYFNCSMEGLQLGNLIYSDDKKYVYNVSKNYKLEINYNV